MMELTEAIGTGNVGLLLDSWHWYTSHGTAEEVLGLSNKDVIHVHVNDAPSGIPVDQQIDNRRRLPVTTGVIDLKKFINALVKIGYDGPDNTQSVITIALDSAPIIGGLDAPSGRLEELKSHMAVEIVN